jgi:hypothetical protein
MFLVVPLLDGGMEDEGMEAVFYSKTSVNFTGQTT